MDHGETEHGETEITEKYFLRWLEAFQRQRLLYCSIKSVHRF